jgi:hypothetical protein
MDTALLAVLVENHKNGEHSQNGWKPHVYNADIKNVCDKCNVDITKENILGAKLLTSIMSLERYFPRLAFDKHYEFFACLENGEPLPMPQVTPAEILAAPLNKSPIWLDVTFCGLMGSLS